MNGLQRNITSCGGRPVRVVSDVIDFGSADEFHLDGVCGIYRVSQNTICVELYANKIVDGKIQKVVVLRNTWDRSCWLAAQAIMARLFTDVAALPQVENGEIHVH